jgi:ATP-dependent 26S proteasome regulatory subunit
VTEEKVATSNVTLSGLLNAIDGTCSPEGHVLIMTTNHPEKLDSALIRSGRISVKIAFSHATRAPSTRHILAPVPGGGALFERGFSSSEAADPSK